MINLLKKEISLSMHPISPIILLLSAMMLIPNYPYYVVFFYTSMAIFFTCLLGRENNDVFYSLSLPVAKKDVVKGRILFASIFEIIQMIIAIPFAFIRQQMSIGGNQAGMDANIALFGLGLILYGIFNMVFFGIYYKNVNKVGKAFVISTIVIFVYVGIVEACAHVVPFVKNYLDTSDSMYVSYKIVVLAIGIAAYLTLTYVTYKRSVVNFNRQDISI